MRSVGKRLPDILIGILIVLLAVGLGSLLLTQRNRAAVPAPSSAPTATIPAAPGSETPSGAATTTAPVQTPNQPAVTSPPVQETPGPANRESTQPDNQTSSSQSPVTTAPVPPTTQTPTTQTPTTQTPTAHSPVTQSPTTQAPTTQTPTAQNPTVQPPAAQTPTAQTPAAQSPTTQPSATQPSNQTPAQPTTPPSTPPNAPAVTAPVQPPVTPKIDTSKPPVVTTHSPVQKIPTTAESPASVSAVPDAPRSPVTPRSSGAVATSENRVPLRRDYRISLGVFSSRAEVQRQTAAVAALGYTVYPIDLGDRVVAQVGPFADALSAQQARQDIARAYSGATVLAPRGAPTPPQAPERQTADQTSSAPNSPATPRAPTDSVSAPTGPNTTNLDWQAPASSAPASDDSSKASEADKSTDSQQKPAPSGPVYLQVGAFDRPESAESMVTQLKGLGYEPSVQAPEGKKVTVLIGPFRGNALLRTETRLDSNGFDHFRVH